MTPALLGIAAGMVFAWLWLWVVPWNAHAVFFAEQKTLLKKILKVDEAGEFFRLYKELISGSARYIGRNIAGTVIAGAPAALLYLLVPGGEMVFLAAFMASMMVVFFWPRLWPARPAF